MLLNIASCLHIIFKAFAYIARSKATTTDFVPSSFLTSSALQGISWIMVIAVAGEWNVGKYPILGFSLSVILSRCTTILKPVQTVH